MAVRPLSVSVALCTFNGVTYIAEQLESILAQSEPPGEIVVSDDGSTDGTLEIVRSIAKRSPVRIRILDGAGHRGITANFERAITTTTGDLIALSDQDDRWRTDRLELMSRRFTQDEDLLLLHHDATLVDGSGSALGATLFQSLRVSRTERRLIDDGSAFAAYIRRNLATGATVMFRRGLVKVAVPFPEEWVHDEWLAAIASAMGRVAVMDDRLVDYRQHQANQIGVSQPTLAYRIGRMLGSRGARYVALAARAEALLQRLTLLDAPSRWVALARSKRDFEAIRAEYPASRPRRILPVLRQRGAYPRLSSQGYLDIVRDIIQPA